MPRKKSNKEYYPYQVINGKVYNSGFFRVQLEPEHFLVSKPLIPLLVNLESRGVSVGRSYEWCSCAAKIGDLEALQWLRDSGAPWDKWVCYYAASNDYLEVLRWARSNGAPWDADVCGNAATNGNLEILQWARSNGAPWNKYTCSNAAENGHLEVLQWARSNGAPWDESVCRYAADKGYFDILKWAYVHGCPCSGKYEQQVHWWLMIDKDITWSLQCKERWSEDDRRRFITMIEKVVNGCNKVTYDLLPTCLSNLIVKYL